MALLFNYEFSFQNTEKKREKKIIPFTTSFRLPYIIGLFE